MSLIREVLWAEGSRYEAFMGGLAMVIVVCALPWIVADGGCIFLLRHYVNFGKTAWSLNFMAKLGQPDAALAFLIALIALPLAIWWAFTNKPVISGLLCITSGVSLIYMFKATQATIVLNHFMYEWSEGWEPFNISVGTYGIMVIGGLLLFSYYRHRRSKMQEIET